MKFRKRVLFILLSAFLLVGQTAKAQSQSSEATPVLEGLDPVMLVRGKEVQGELNITVTRGEFQYLFANQRIKPSLKKTLRVTRYSSAALARVWARPSRGNPDLFAVHKERIYIFGSADCKKLFQAAPEKYTLPVESAGPAATPDAIKKGKALIEKAVSAIGGAARLDTLVNYQEQRKALQRRP